MVHFVVVFDVLMWVNAVDMRLCNQRLAYSRAFGSVCLYELARRISFLSLPRCHLIRCLCAKPGKKRDEGAKEGATLFKKNSNDPEQSIFLFSEAIFLPLPSIDGVQIPYR